MIRFYDTIEMHGMHVYNSGLSEAKADMAEFLKTPFRLAGGEDVVKDWLLHSNFKPHGYNMSDDEETHCLEFIRRFSECVKITITLREATDYYDGLDDEFGTSSSVEQLGIISGFIHILRTDINTDPV